MDYRREIDGLRAVAIVPVILFHAGFQVFSGGFVGVDVFFVISGYLITTILISELEQGRFSVIDFYERRARRILPALFFVMFACLPFAWMWLLPQDLKLFSQGIIAVSLFSSNILFGRTSGYFESSAELNPLLHTWSLAVEEQYYVIFPIFLMLAWRFGRRSILAILVTAGCLSLALAQWAVYTQPGVAFYLLPARGWELLVGAIVALYISFKPTWKPNKIVSEALAMLGLALILLSVFSFNSQTPFPGLYALTPTLGSALIIVFASSETLTGRLLGLRVIVGIGLLSYSAYLWHQPLLAFARHSVTDEPSPYLFASLVVASFILGYFSWKYVEAPFRNRTKINKRKIFRFSLTGGILLLVIGLIGNINRGFEGRIGEDEAAFLRHFENSIPEWNYFTHTQIPTLYRDDCNFYDVSAYRRGGSTKVPVDEIPRNCFSKNSPSSRSVFIWGDSHAQQLYSGLKNTLPGNWEVLQVASSGCKAELDAPPNKRDYCNYSNWFALKSITDAQPDVVIIGQNLSHQLGDMLSMSERLKSIGVKKIIFTGPTPHWRQDLPKIVAYKLWQGKPERTFAGSNRDVFNLDQALKKGFPQSSSVRYVSIVDNFCNARGCLVYIGPKEQENITSWDYGHLTPTASRYLAENILAKEVLGGT